MANKMTNKMALTFVLENCELPTEISDKLTAMLDQINKKSAAKKSESETDKAHMELILNVLSADEGMTCTEIQKSIPELNTTDISNQRVSGYMRKLKADGLVTNKMEKGKSKFYLA